MKNNKQTVYYSKLLDDTIRIGHTHILHKDQNHTLCDLNINIPNGRWVVGEGKCTCKKCLKIEKENL